MSISSDILKSVETAADKVREVITKATASAGTKLDLREATANGSSKIVVHGPASLAANRDCDISVITPGETSKVVAHSTGATLALTSALHALRTVYVTVTDGLAITLPAAVGTGDVYTVYLGATVATASTIKTASGTDDMLGTAILFADGGATVVAYAATAGDDSINLLGTGNSTGGIAGASYKFTDVGTAKWHVEIVSDAAGTEATPFSATY